MVEPESLLEIDHLVLISHFLEEANQAQSVGSDLLQVTAN